MGRGNQQEHDQGRRTGKGSTLSGAQGARDAAQQKQDKAHRQKINDWATRSNRESRSGTKGPGTGPCFVATAAYGDFDAPEVLFLRGFRDEFLSASGSGRAFIRFYYTVSPPLAALITRSESMRAVVRRWLLQPLISLIKAAKK